VQSAGGAEASRATPDLPSIHRVFCRQLRQRRAFDPALITRRLNRHSKSPMPRPTVRMQAAAIARSRLIGASWPSRAMAVHRPRAIVERPRFLMHMPKFDHPREPPDRGARHVETARLPVFSRLARAHASQMTSPSFPHRAARSARPGNVCPGDSGEIRPQPRMAGDKVQAGAYFLWPGNPPTGAPAFPSPSHDTIRALWGRHVPPRPSPRQRGR